MLLSVQNIISTWEVERPNQYDHETCEISSKINLCYVEPGKQPLSLKAVTREQKGSKLCWSVGRLGCAN